jgi:hypothetical protein
MTANPCPRLNMVAPVVLFLGDHMSHKDFAPPLSETSQFKTNENKSRGKFDEYLSCIRLKFETTEIDSNFID